MARATRIDDPHFERTTREEIRAFQLKRLRALVRRAYRDNPFYRKHWSAAKVDPEAIESLEAFAARIPTVGKQEFFADQQADPPFGTRAARARELKFPLFVSTTSGTSGKGQEVHVQTPLELESMGRVYSFLYRWSGLEPGDSLMLAMPLTMMGGGRLEYHGAQSYGLGVLPVGNYDAEGKIEALHRFEPQGLIGITAYLGRLASLLEDRAPPSSLKCVLTGAEGAGIEWMRRLAESWGAPVFDRYGSSQAGSDHMFTCEQGLGTPERPGMLHNIDPYVLAEVIDQGTGQHVADGEAGELVVTVLYREYTPIIRCRMGDRAVYHDADYCSCDRPFMGVEVSSISRIDDMHKIKGVNVWPQAVDDVVFEHRGIQDYQVALSSGRGGQDVATLLVMPAPGLAPAQIDQLRHELRRSTEKRIGIRFEVETVEPGSMSVEWKARRWRDGREHVRHSPPSNSS